MKKLIILLLFINVSIAFGQKAYEPQILILAPSVTKYDEVFEKEILALNLKIKEDARIFNKQQNINSLEFEMRAQNIQVMVKSQIEFSEDINFFKQASVTAGNFLAALIYQRFPDFMIKLSNAKSNGMLDDLQKFSKKDGLQYVLNLSSIELYKQNEISYAKMKIQLYDNVLDSILIDKFFVGDWISPGFEFGCENKTLKCSLSNAILHALEEVLYAVASNSPTLKREKQLQKERFNAFIKNYLNQPFDKIAISNIIPVSDTNINVAIAYQALFNNDKSKFVAFFLEQVKAQDLKTLSDSKKYNNVIIISNQDTKHEALLDAIPQTYAYIVKGVRYSDKWYYEKANTTYFQAETIEEGQQDFLNNLQRWRFFKENSTQPSQDFWETILFAKVLDRTKDPNWYGRNVSTWKAQEINDRPYIGMYEIVANNLRRKLEEENSEFNGIATKLFNQFYLQLKSKDSGLYHKISEYSLIYPVDKSVVISPTVVTSANGNMVIHYFVIIADQGNVFEWNYFKHKEVADDSAGGQMVEQINTLTDWTFSVDNLNDAAFWNKYVLMKTRNKYRYLDEVR